MPLYLPVQPRLQRAWQLSLSTSSPLKAGVHALGGGLTHVARAVGLAALLGGAGQHLPYGRHEPLSGVHEGAQEVRQHLVPCATRQARPR